MQALLGNLASKVELAEREAQSGDNSSGALAPQESVGDALKDIMLAEKALGSFETQLDSLLDRLDELIDEAPESKKNKVTS
ncbi:hypothetical protein GGF43_004176 [Coemansia sp. RSA 2618]|nr:hypothetical protein GGF43_004176 [Coemansia sp. RSA 2618]